jgi:hypothetical protein
MPRKKKTIKDFTYSNDHTTQINTTHRNVKKISSTIIIDFTDLKIKTYRYLNIHSIHDDDIHRFLGLLNTIVPINMDFIKIKKKASTTYECDWNQMPSYNTNKNMDNYGTLLLTIEVVDNDDYINFVHHYHHVFGCILWPTVTFMWYPERSSLLSLYKDKMYLSTTDHQPKYPIYIISKGRYEKRYTSKYLEWIGVDYKIVI